MVDNDTELMAALFVSEDGVIEAHPNHAEELQFTIEQLYRCSWEHCGAVPSCVRSVVWSRLSVPEPVAAGILRLIRERDEARNVAEAYAEPHSEKFAPPWEVKP